MRRPLFLFLFLLLGVPRIGTAQYSAVPDVNDPVHVFLERQASLGNIPHSELASLPLSRFEIGRILDSLQVLRPDLSRVDRQALDYFTGQVDHRGRPLRPDTSTVWFANGHDLVYAEGDDFDLSVTPLLRASVGRVSRETLADVPDTETTWEFNRGIQASGRLGRGFFFDARIQEVQSRPANREMAADRTAPRLRAVKVLDDETWDYGIGRAVIGYHSKHIELRMGRDRMQLGGGLNTFWLSDHASEFDFVQFRASFWRIRYTGTVAAFDDLDGRSVSGTVPRKHGGFHVLSVQLSKRWTAEFYEGMVVTDDTLSGVRSGLDLALFNPLLHLKQVEWDYDRLGSKFIGLGSSFLAGRGHSFWAQLLLTEFTASKIFSEPGYWANKWGVLFGYRYAPSSLPLIAGLEYSTARPHTYSHQQSGTSFIHYGDELGHPAGQNFVDWSAYVFYGAGGPWEASFVGSHTLNGTNTESVNFGGDSREPYTTRHSDDDNHILQGRRATTWLADVAVSRQIFPSVYVGLAGEFMRFDRDGDDVVSRVNPRVSLRWGMPVGSQRN